ncbi:GIY-YIG nuclease family protein [Paenimyroides baculatum]|uniref:Endonuclease n=1 Tax=Paenimyroides baculatum TaxID=2608000 RepID=A0A5M6C9V8_9FLAO|nr:GIY-YIG nuclease family protein [Paenimyroides baculatum]KAA5531884.1 endonuclease [Paenimyroides baculatum]
MNKIYLVWNIFTAQFYVGSTTKEIKGRILDHFQKSAKKVDNKFHKAIENYGSQAFDYLWIDFTDTTDELAQKEAYYIEAYNALSAGYNSDRGGGFRKTIYKFEMNNIEPIATYDTLEEAGNSVNASRKTISNACLGSLKTAKGFLWSYTPEYPEVEDKRSKIVYQYGLDGLLLATFSTACEASKVLGIGLSSITRCCRGERKQTSGYKFCYK